MRKFSVHPAILTALGSAVLFGASVPLAKQLLGGLSPLLLAGILYLGSGIGLIIFRLIKDRAWRPAGLLKGEWRWLIGAIFFGGVLAPTLFMIGLMQTSAATTSLLLNLESVLTAVLAWVFFKEHTDRRMVVGMLCIVAGGVVLSLNEHLTSQGWLGSLSIAAACFCWAIDNNLTRNISTADPVFITGSKGLVAGIVNISLAVSLGLMLPAWKTISEGLLLGFFGYGISLVLFVLALRGLGTVRTGAYFSTAPFIGAAIAILFFHNAVTISFGIAAILMLIGVWIHLMERHEHSHTHMTEAGEITHSHPHYPDVHHRHSH